MKMFCTVFLGFVNVRDREAATPEEAARQHVAEMGVEAPVVTVTWEDEGQLRYQSYDSKTFQGIK